MKISGRLSAHASHIIDVEYLADDTSILSVGMDGKVRQWDGEAGKLLIDYDGHSKSVNSVAIGPDREEFITGATSGDIKHWNLWEPDVISTYSDHTDLVSEVCVHPEASQFISGSYDSTVKLWEFECLTPQQSFEEHTQHVVTVAFSASGDFLASAGIGENVFVRNLESMDVVKLSTGANAIVRAAFLPAAEEKLSVVSKDGDVAMWDVSTANQIMSASIEPAGQYPIAIPSDGDRIIVGVSDGIQIVDRTGDLKQRYQFDITEVQSLALSPDDSQLVLGTTTGELIFVQTSW